MISKRSESDSDVSEEENDHVYDIVSDALRKTFGNSGRRSDKDPGDVVINIRLARRNGSDC